MSTKTKENCTKHIEKHFSSDFFDLFLHFAILFKYTSASGDLSDMKVDQNDLANVHVFTNPATFDSNGR